MTLASAVSTAAAGVGGFAYAYEVAPEQVTVDEVSVTLPRMTRVFDELRLVQISDFHLGRWMPVDRLHAVVDRVNALDADLVAITGDYVHHDALAQAEELVPVLSRIRARDAVIGVMGNHDHWAGVQTMRQVVAAGGVTDLRNTALPLQRGSDTLWLCGVDDYLERIAKLPMVMDALPQEGAAILLAHEPDFADISAATGRFDLQLSGHSHGGQVIAPIVGPLVLPRFGKKYPLGHYWVERMQLYTNRGIGVVSPPIRFNCRPEITVFTLRAGRA